MAAEPYTLSSEEVEGTLCMRVEGKFDRVAGLAVEALREEHPGPCLLNLSQVEYLSSSGIAMLVKLSTALGVRLAEPAECVANTLSLAGIEKILTIYANEAEARDAPR